MTTANKQIPLFGSESSAAIAGQKRTTCMKGRDGWESTTDVFIGDAQLLRITTGKANRGGVKTQARVYTIDGGRIRTQLYGDYSKELTCNASFRCLESTVNAQHVSVLQKLEVIRADVVRFYEKKRAGGSL